MTLPRLSRLLSCAAMALGLSAWVQAQTIHPGLWEFKHEMRQPGQPGQPDLTAQMAQMRAQMTSLPPEARKIMEQQLAGMGMGMGEQGALRLCIRPEEAAQEPIREGHKEGDCTYTQVTRSGNTWRGRMVCTDPPSQGEFTTTLHNPTHFATTAVLKSSELGRIDVKTDARRVSADCGALAKAPRPPTVRP